MHKRRFLLAGLIGILLLGLSGGAWAGVIRVKAGVAGGDGTSWAKAYPTLTAALAVAKSGDEIWVATGTYTPTSDANRNISFVMVSGVGVYGGFAGGEAVRDQRNWNTHPTILSGDIGTKGNVADNTYRVVVGARLAVLDGFTITAGNGGSGSGMFNSNCGPAVNNCTFTGNTSGSGGAMYNYNGSTPTISNCSFTGNSVTHEGGAVYNRAGGAPQFINCTFSGNTGANGAAMYNDSCSPVVTNCTFTGNIASVAGGGLYGINNSATVNNCIFWNNTAPSGAEIFTKSGTPTFSHCDIKGSGGSGTWLSVLGANGGGNIDAAPLFRNAAQSAGADGLWRTSDDGLVLLAGSPCINAGLAAGAPSLDILGNARNGAPDLGAYEYVSVAPTAAIGQMAITYRLTNPSMVPPGQTVQYTYRWTSDGGDILTHGPTAATSDTLIEMSTVQAGETWTVTVTPSSGGLNGPTTSAKVKILDPKNRVHQWILYR